MKWSGVAAAALITLSSGCAAVIGSTGQDTSFERVGTLNCDGTDVTSQSYVQGTAADPVRCGPQSQPVAP